MRAHLTATHLTAALALAGAAAVATPAAAQIYDTPVYAEPAYSPAYVVPAYNVVSTGYVEELVVPAPQYRDGRLTRLSRVVSIRDLNLVMPQDREILRIRIRDTARDICRALGEDNFIGSSIPRSCQDQAIRDARPQVRLAIDQAYARASYASLEARDPYAWQPY
jgi:UrcA family protein